MKIERVGFSFDPVVLNKHSQSRIKRTLKWSEGKKINRMQHIRRNHGINNSVKHNGRAH